MITDLHIKGNILVGTHFIKQVTNILIVMGLLKNKKSQFDMTQISHTHEILFKTF